MPAKNPVRRKRKRRPVNRLLILESVIADIRRGKMVIVVDDEDRENEGPDHGRRTPHLRRSISVKHGRGLICVPTTEDRLRQLGIERMVPRNKESFQTDLASVDSAIDITTGISAKDRAKTIQTMADPTAVPDDLATRVYLSVARPPWWILQRAGLLKRPWTLPSLLNVAQSVSSANHR